MPEATMLLVTGGLPLGGSTTFLANLAHGLPPLGWKVVVASCETNQEMKPDLLASGAKLEEPDGPLELHEDRMDWLKSICLRHHPSALVANLGSEGFELLRWVPRGHLRIGMAHADHPFVEARLAAYAPWMDVAVGVSSKIATRLSQLVPIQKAKVEVRQLDYGIPMPDLPLPPKPTDRFHFVYAGRMIQEQKRVQLFPQILGHLAKSGLEMTWHLAGDGPEKAGLIKQMGTGLGSVKVEFHGNLQQPELIRLLEQQHALLLASDYEGLPLSLLEAMGRGVTTVASRLTSGLPEVVDDQCGILVDPNHVQGYAEGLIQLAQNPEQCRTLGQRSIDRVREKYSREAMAQRWKQLLDRPLHPREPWQWPKVFPMPVECKRPWLFSTPGRWVRRLARRCKAMF